MAKEYKTQRRKSTLAIVFDTLFKVLVAIAVLIFMYIIYDKTDFSSSSMKITPKKSASVSSDSPSELRWFDSFKGIENIPDEKKKKEKNSNSNGSTGFKYEGFKK